MTHEHNTKINEILQGCGERTGILNGMWICGEEPKKGIIKLCPSCKAKLQCILLAQENEVAFVDLNDYKNFTKTLGRMGNE